MSPDDLDAFVQVFEWSDWDDANLTIDDKTLVLKKILGRPLLMRWGTAQREGELSALYHEVVAPHVATFELAHGAKSVLAMIGESITATAEIAQLRVLDDIRPLRAGKDGILRELCASAGELVDCGQVLMRIETA